MDVANIRSIRVRSLVCLLLLSPTLVGYPALKWAGLDGDLQLLGIWGGYCLVLNMYILNAIGLRQWSGIFAFAALTGLFTALSGAFVSYLGSLFSEYFLVQQGGSASGLAKGLLGVAHFRQLLLILGVIPTSLYIARSFPPGEMIQRSLLSTGKTGHRTRTMILVLRVVNHVLEAVVSTFPLWREETPHLLVPRDVEEKWGVLGRYSIVTTWRAIAAIEAFCRSVLIRTLEPLPVFVREVQSLDEIRA